MEGAVLYVNGRRRALPAGRAQQTLLSFLRGACGTLAADGVAAPPVLPGVAPVLAVLPVPPVLPVSPVAPVIRVARRFLCG